MHRQQGVWEVCQTILAFIVGGPPAPSAPGPDAPAGSTGFGRCADMNSRRLSGVGLQEVPSVSGYAGGGRDAHLSIGPGAPAPQQDLANDAARTASAPLDWRLSAAAARGNAHPHLDQRLQVVLAGNCKGAILVRHRNRHGFVCRKRWKDLGSCSDARASSWRGGGAFATASSTRSYIRRVCTPQCGIKLSASTLAQAACNTHTQEIPGCAVGGRSI